MRGRTLNSSWWPACPEFFAGFATKNSGETIPGSSGTSSATLTSALRDDQAVPALLRDPVRNMHP